MLYRFLGFILRHVASWWAALWRLCPPSSAALKPVVESNSLNEYGHGLEIRKGDQGQADYVTLADGRCIPVVDANGEFISGGLSGIVELLPDGTVLKSPFFDEDKEKHREDIAKEARIYQLLRPHDRLVKFIKHSDQGLHLEYMENGCLKDYLREHPDVSMQQRLKWALQAAEGLQLLHSNDIIHCDVKPSSYLLDKHLDLKIIDFSDPPPTIARDLFALGSTIYEITTGTSPYQEVPSNKVTELYEQRNFPDVSSIVCGEVVRKCWGNKIHSAQTVCDVVGKLLDTF